MPSNNHRSISNRTSTNISTRRALLIAGSACCIATTTFAIGSTEHTTNTTATTTEATQSQDQPPAFDRADISNEAIAALVQRAAQRLVEMEEGAEGVLGEWPYEGVYRVREPGLRGAVIPIGYRVGGTAIVALAMIRAPGFDDDPKRVQAVQRAVNFIEQSTEHPLMSPDDYAGGYDVRGWGYIYALLFLQELADRQSTTDQLKAQANTAIDWYLRALHIHEIPQSGGWNYARRGEATEPAPAAPFMTSPALQALFLARSQNRTPNDDAIARGLETLARAKRASGEFVYSGTAERRAGGVPGATGRMLVSETTLFLAGRATIADVRGAIDAFFAHWDALEVRRKQTGTHIPPWGVAPYYFYFAHTAAAQAIELLPQPERDEYRRRFRETLLRTLDDDDTWNDRVFPRSANYGTAMSIIALTMPQAPKSPRFEPEQQHQP